MAAIQSFLILIIATKYFYLFFCDMELFLCRSLRRHRAPSKAIIPIFVVNLRTLITNFPIKHSVQKVTKAYL